VSRLVRQTKSWLYSIVALLLALAILGLLAAGVVFLLKLGGVTVEVGL
jgi:hypothetical protein